MTDKAGRKRRRRLGTTDYTEGKGSWEPPITPITPKREGEVENHRTHRLHRREEEEWVCRCFQEVPPEDGQV
jgi:hypothetical protein